MWLTNFITNQEIYNIIKLILQICMCVNKSASQMTFHVKLKVVYIRMGRPYCTSYNRSNFRVLFLILLHNTARYFSSQLLKWQCIRFAIAECVYLSNRAAVKNGHRYSPQGKKIKWGKHILLPRLGGAFDLRLAVSVPLPIVMGIFVLLWFQSRLT